MANNPSQGLPVVRIENTGAAQTNVPFTFGQVFKVGALKPGAGLAAQVDGATVPLQVDYKATHSDGSVRHAIVSGILPKLAAGATAALQLVEAKAVASKALSPAAMPDGAVEIMIAGVKYSTNGSNFGGVIEWLSGPVVAEGIISADLLGPDGKPHTHLNVRAGIRAYASGHVRVEVVVENNKALRAGAANFTYDVAVKLAGKTVFEQKALTHYHHADWRKLFWVSQEPSIYIKPDVPYLIESQAVSNYDQSIKPSESLLDSFDKATIPSRTAPMAIGPVTAYMGMTGGRPDIGPLPGWTVAYLLSLDKRAYEAMIAAADGSGSWSVHYRDENTGYPIRADNEANAMLTTHSNLSKIGPLPLPRSAASPYAEDVAHQPSLTYVPYLLTGEYFYLEELQFWAAWNPLGTDPSNSGRGLGLLRWHQVRGQAWALRTLGHAAYATPDSHPLKAYFLKQLDNNLQFYYDAYVVGKPNKLGAYDGSGPNAAPINGSPTWQDDFLTWSFGYLGELGFEKAKPIFQWKAKYPVGRMTAPGYCWIKATAYSLKIRPDGSDKVFDDFADVYLANFSGDSIVHEGDTKTHPKGIKFIDMPCATQEMADWFNASSKFGWGPKRMDGYADSVEGYPANLQPALALTAQYGVEDADLAWQRFESRDAKPKYQNGPQWNIIPRNYKPVVIAPVPVPTPTPTPAPVPVPVIDGEWEKIGVEGKKLTVPAGSTVRYGVAGVGYVEKEVGGEFTANNAFFGKDPAPNKVKDVELKKVKVPDYSIKEKTVFVLVKTAGKVEIAEFGDKANALEVLSKILK
jgi:hypothetical protein